MDVEHCAGCGREAAQHPMVGVLHISDAEGLDIIGVPNARSFVGVPVCVRCWQFPAERTRPLKCHFFHRGQSATAIAAAGAQTIQAS